LTLEGGRVRVDLRPITSLLPHEETIEAKVEEMAAQLLRDGVQKDPLIIDQRSRVVLDGMHRLGAFSKIGTDHVVCYPVDYSSPQVQVRRWARVYATSGLEAALAALNELGISRPESQSEAFVRLEKGEERLVVLAQRRAYLPADRKGTPEESVVVRAIDNLADSRSWKRTFVPEEEVDLALRSDENLVLIVQQITKQDVLKAATTRRLFPPKTSMHVIDPRPVGVNTAISDLRGGSTKTIKRQVALLGRRVLPPGSFYEGRRYKERLLILSEP